MKLTLSDYLLECEKRCQKIFARLQQQLDLNDRVPCGEAITFSQAYRYSLESSGKCIRPALCYATASALGMKDGRVIDPLASALELIHTYSLIHDDLPAMDDDDLRRGRPSLHNAYNEATAILVGDGLQAMAFELLAEAPGLSAEQRLTMINALASAAGPQGMVGGQYIDTQANGAEMTLAQLQAMHSLKTGALIRAAIALGGIAAQGTEQELKDLDTYGTRIGLAFQVADDILDVEGKTETLGKTVGKDQQSDKATYVRLLGLEGAKIEVRRLLREALEALDAFDDRADHLRDLAHYIVNRDH